MSWRRSLARFAYTSALRLLTPLLLARLAWRGRREPLYTHAVGERLGLGAPTEPGALWLHAVSLGETRAAEPLIQALRAARPGLRLLLTHGTATGRETGATLLRPGDAQRWLPFDTPGAVRRFLRRHRPTVGVLMETEVWPNLQAEAARAGVPMVLANARLSDKSLRQAQRFEALLRPAVASMAAVLAQTEADAQRLRAAGAAAVAVCGNVKFDLQPDPALLAQGRRWRDAAAGRPIVLAASWREGEDAPLLSAWAAQCAAWRRASAGAEPVAGAAGPGSAATAPSAPADAASAGGVPAGEVGGGGVSGGGLSAGVATSSGGAAGAAPAPPFQTARLPLLVLVPRHPQRFDEVAALVQAAGLRLARRSTWRDAEGREGAAAQPDASAADADVWLGDSMRELPAYYALADVALLGGSYAPLGGQNLIEAAACGCPVVMGPHTFNFAEAAQRAEAQGAARRVASLDAGVAEALRLAAQPEAQAAMATAARHYAAAHQGAARRMAERIVAFFDD